MGRPRIHPDVPGEPSKDRQGRLARERGWRKLRESGAKQRSVFVFGETQAERTKRLVNENRIAKRRAAGIGPRTKMSRETKLAKIRAANHVWRARNLDHARKWARDYQKKNMVKIAGVVKDQKHRRRSVTRIGHVSASDWAAIKEAFDRRCAYCLRQLTRLEQDHVTALSRGGEHSPDNVVPACRSCNARKGNRGILTMLKVA